MRKRVIIAGAGLLIALDLLAPLSPGRADTRQDACKKAMNERIQVCTDDCTKTALAAASSYVDTNNNVKFGCLKGCAIRQVWQMKACRGDAEAQPGEPTETNR